VGRRIGKRGAHETNGLVADGFEGVGAGEEDIEEHARGVDVGGAADGGDAEVEEAEVAGRGDENVGEFEIEVGELALVLIERRSVDIVHDEVGNAVGGDASIDESDDVGMAEGGEDLLFGAEAAAGEAEAADDLSDERVAGSFGRHPDYCTVSGEAAEQYCCPPTAAHRTSWVVTPETSDGTVTLTCCTPVRVGAEPA